MVQRRCSTIGISYLEDIQMVMAELDAAEQRCIHSLGGLKTDGD